MNEHQAREAQRRKMQQQFLQALSAGQIFPVDRFGNKVEVGMRVLYHLNMDLIFDVIGVAPVLDPRVPPGMVTVQLAVSFPVQTQANVVNPMMIAMGKVESAPSSASEPEAPRDPTDSESDDRGTGPEAAGGDPGTSQSPLSLVPKPEDPPAIIGPGDPLDPVF